MNKVIETKQKLRSAVIEANTLRKLQAWLSKLGDEPIDSDLVLHYIDETKKYLTNQYEAEQKAKQQNCLDGLYMQKVGR